MGRDLLVRLRDRPVLRSLSTARASLVALLLVVATIASARTVRVAIDDQSHGRRCSQDARIVAEAGATKVHGTPAALDLDDAQAWRVRAEASDCWSRTATWIGTNSGDELTLALHDAASLEGTFVLARGELVQELAASAYRTAETKSRAPLAEPEPLTCRVSDDRWQCVVPAGLKLDVRLEPQGFAPVYLWNVQLSAREKRTSDPQKLVRGASVAGWVETPDETPLAGAVVTLAPLVVEHEQADRLRAAEHRAITNERGFFQLTGVSPGEYRLVSRSSAFAPVVVPVITVRDNTALTWPKPLRHSKAFTVQLTVSPPAAPDGSAWRISLTELVPLTPGSSPASITFKRNEQNLWSAANVRPDLYELFVKDASGAVVEKRTVDFSAGAPEPLTVAITTIALSGTITAGDEPLGGAHIRFSTIKGKTVIVDADEHGRFAASFPSTGKWSILVFPFGREHRAQVRATAVEIRADDSKPLEIQLPGGRIRGTVVGQDGAPVKAAVHVVTGNALAAQQVTAKDGKFDLLGLQDATYEISAEAEEGTTATPVIKRVGRDDTSDLKLTVAPYRFVRGLVYAPNGRPASGAIARISTDGGLSWSDMVVGVDGRFAYALPGVINELQLIVISHSYPTAMMRARVSESLVIQLQPFGGLLRVEPDRAFVIRNDVAVPLSVFYLPFSMGVVPRVHLEPGSYSVCAEPKIDRACKQVLIAQGTSTTISLRDERKP